MLFYSYFHMLFFLPNAILLITYHSICLIGLSMKRQTATLLSTLSTFRSVHFAYWFFEAVHFLICKAGGVHSFRCLSVTALPLMPIGCSFDHLLEVSKLQEKQPRGILAGSQCRLKNILAPCLLMALYIEKDIKKTRWQRQPANLRLCFAYSEMADWPYPEGGSK